MTPKQRTAHIETLKKLIIAAGFKINRYGAYQRSLNNQTYRIKFKKVNLRIEAKTSAGWVNISSRPISQVTTTDLLPFLAKFFKADSQSKKIQPSQVTLSRPAHKKHDYQVSIIWYRSDGLRLLDMYYIQAYSSDLAERHALDRLHKDNAIHKADVESISAHQIKHGSRLVSRTLPANT